MTGRYGPQDEHIAALVERLSTLTMEDVQRIPARPAARDAARDTAWCAVGVTRSDAWAAAADAAREAAWAATWTAAGDAARAAPWDAGAAPRATAWSVAVTAEDAAVALVVRDVLAPKHYLTLTTPMRAAGIVVHPDDGPLPAT